MRRLGFLLIGAALGVSAPAHAQQAAPRAPAPPTALAAPAQEPLYDASLHGGIPEGAWLRMTRGTGRRSTGMMATGIVLVGLGVVFMATGTAIYATKASCDALIVPTNGGGAFQPDCPQGGPHGTGMAMMLAGVIGAAVGVPLWVLGGSDVPWAEAAQVHAPARPAWAAAAPAIVGAPGGAGLAWRF